MKILTPGHKYSLAPFEPGGDHQFIQFIQKEKSPFSEDENLFTTVENGTTNEEVLAMLIDRLKFLDDKLPSRESKAAITKCEEALLWLNYRTSNRKARGVEGTPQP